MPLRFRSVVPYTLPGVLALIGWWWYISRKKERTIMGHDATEETPPTVGHLTSPTAGSNGLVEKGTTVSPTIDTTTRDTTTRDTPPHVKEQRSTEQDVTAQVHIQATKTSPTTTQDQCFDREVLLNDKVRAGLGNHTDNTADSSRLPPSIEEEPRSCRRVPDKDRLEDLLDQGALPTLATQREKDVVQEPVVSALECRAEAAFSSHRSPPQVIHNTHTAATGLTNAARPEPEGEIATQEVSVRCAAQPIKDVHATIATTKDENIFSPAATLAKKAPEESSPTSMQSSYHHVLTSTPISLTPATASAAAQVVPVQDSSTRGGLASEDSLVVSQRGQQEEEGSGARSEEQELEHLAAGLITEVISAATQEVLGVVARCRGDVTDGSSQPPGCINNSTTLLANGGGLCSQQQQPIITRETAAEQHSLLQGGGPSPIGGPGDSRESQWEEGEQGLPNGCASALVWEPSSAEVCRDHGDNNEEDNVQSSYSPVVSSSHLQAAAQQGGATTTLPVLSRLKEGLAEDSACSTTFHSSEVDGVSNRNLQTGVPENRVVDLIRGVKDMSEQPPSLLLPQLSAAAEADASEAAAAAAVVALTTEEEEEEEEEHGGIDAAVCEMKRLNRVGLRNGAHGAPSETETDQSGGSDVNSMDSVDSGCTMGAGDSLSSQTTGQGSEVIIWDIEVPKHLVGRLIGKQGRYVSFLKQNSGAKIYISTLPYTQEFQICHIEGTQQQVDKALSLIGKKFKDLDLTNLYAPPPPPLTLPSLPMTSWLMLPSGVTVEVIVVNIVSAGHVFVQQHTHPTYHALRSLDQQMLFCYSQPGTPALPSPAVGVICAAPALEGAWWRAQVITFYKETNEVEIRYVDYGGYDRVKIDTLRQIRSDFVTLPFQGAEVLLDNIAPLPGEDRFSTEASTALEEMTRGVPLLAQVSNYDNNTGLPLVQLWNMVGEEVILLNRTLAERGFGTWVDSF